ncbi:DUF4880 domain-containing protein [Brenneria izadpanahii]|uniref:DUF4880 domain-containing protein n=1 Tax=Brenneria izadpanahii TaxID=2722756 RepID=A0ABX7UWK8_9GAMM|nr:DUF4880 domain-containing protein [Brenneria izadpanahii]QTF08722.1 DUF4880 domain-containing protein [Brenneria izadpanahii]
MEARTWLIRLTSGRATTNDAAAFRQWLAQSPEHYAAFAEIRMLWRQMEPALLTAPSRSAAGGAPVNKTRRAMLAGAMCAAGVLATRQLFDWPRLPGSSGDFSTAAGEQKSILLRQDITLEINTRTQIDVLASAPQSTSLELRKGEAQIQALGTDAGEVSVKAGVGTVLARNAWFNILYFDDNVSVTCLEGQVQVRCEQASLTLLPGEQVRYAYSRLLPVTQVDLRKVLAWRYRQILFDHTPLSDVIAEVNRYRKGRIILLNKELARRQVHGRFSLEQLDDVIDLIHRSYGARVTTLPGDIVLLS